MKIHSLFLVFLVCLLFSSCTVKNPTIQTSLRESSVPPAVQTNTKESVKITEQNGDDLISMDVCNKKYSSWKSIVVADAVAMKAPSYIKQDPGYGGQTLEINNSNYGHISMSTFLVGEFQPEGAVSFQDKLEFLINNVNDSFVEAQFYRDSADKIIVKGNGRYTITAKNSDPVRWWMFSTMSQEQSEDSTKKERAFMESDDFNCLLRSVHFIW